MGNSDDRSRIRREIESSKKRGGYLPESNPYSVAPRWMPYFLARMFQWVMAANDNKPVRKRKRRRD